MPDYKQTDVNGTQWQRCRAIVIDNGYAQQPQISFQEERITTVSGGQVFTQPAGGMSLAFDPERQIDLLDPQTGAPTGQTLSFGQMYVALWSLYMSEAAKRDSMQGV